MIIHPKLDLVLELEIDLTPEEIWKGWTTPDLLCKWFCPSPWKVTEAEVDLKPGGIFRFVMQSPEGQQFPNEGCILVAETYKKFVWTSALLSNFRPLPPDSQAMLFTGEIYLQADGKKTKYTAIARHGNEDDFNKHAQMGFKEGWTACARQLETLMKSLR